MRFQSHFRSATGMSAASSFFTALGMLALAVLPAHAQEPARLEMHTVHSMTFKTEQILTDAQNGVPVFLAGELRIPKPGTDKLPAVVLVHGSGGISASTENWARELNAIGVAAFILDSFSGRGIVSTVTNQAQLDSLAMTIDAYRALGQLSAHKRIDASRIAVMGFSKGAVAALYSSNRRFHLVYGPPDFEFAAHIGLYTPCNVRYRDDTKVTGKPIRLFHGIADDYVSIEPCRAYVKRLQAAGADAVLTEYPDAHHAYDNPARPQPVHLPDAQTSRNCELRELRGEVLNAKTEEPYTLADPCIEKGAHVGYNAAAHAATVAAVKEFLSKTFKLGE